MLIPGAPTSLIQKVFFACSQGSSCRLLFCFRSLSSKFCFLKAAAQNHGDPDPESYSGWFGIKEGPLSPLCCCQGNPHGGVSALPCMEAFFVCLNKTEKPAQCFALSPLILAIFTASLQRHCGIVCAAWAARGDAGTCWESCSIRSSICCSSWDDTCIHLKFPWSRYAGFWVYLAQ